MQALADVLLGMDHRVTGSDIADFPERGRLEAKGATVLIGAHKRENVPSDIDQLIYTSAIAQSYPHNDHPEVLRARELGVGAIKRSKFIGELMKDKVGITVSGAHGKTTTATLLMLMLQAGGLTPSALIGAEVKSLQGCGIVGGGQFMIVEACEYDRSFLDMKPKIAVLINVEADHLDYYEDIAEIKEAFGQFLELVPADGLVIAGGDDANIRDILPRAQSPVITFGFQSGNDLRATEVNYRNGKTYFQADGLKAQLNFPGKHLVLDALAAIAVARYLGVSDDNIKQALDKFEGAKRRFEVLGEINKVAFVDDYGHHPTEIKAMLSSTRDYFGQRKIRVVFQPHQFSRTRLLLSDFAQSFSEADEVLVAPILPVRDDAREKQLISSEKLVDAINRVRSNAKAMKDFEEITNYLKETLAPGDVVLSLGAGKNSEWIHSFVSSFRQS